MLPQSSGLKSKSRKTPARNRQKAVVAANFRLGSCMSYTSAIRMKVTCSSETSVDFHKIHDVLSQKVEIVEYQFVFIIVSSFAREIHWESDEIITYMKNEKENFWRWKTIVIYFKPGEDLASVIAIS
jgi:hypothetical protein